MALMYCHRFSFRACALRRGSIEPMTQDDSLYAGLSGLDLMGTKMHLGHGLMLSPTYAHVMSSVILAFSKPQNPGEPHPGPWKATSSGFGYDVQTQLYIPATYNRKKMDRFAVARSLVCLLRLWSDPKINFTFVSKFPFSDLPNMPHSPEMVAAAVEIQRRHLGFGLIDESTVLKSLSWIQLNWEAALDLLETSSEFRLAMDVFEIGFFIPSSAMVMVALWGALEALFSGNTAELKFRVSSLIAAYMKAPGPERLAEQKRIGKLYDKRSAAAHGTPKHSNDDLLRSYELLRLVLIRMIEHKKVPTKDDLEALLFGI